MGFILVLANLADLDILLGFLVFGDAHRLHGGITHSVIFAFFVSCLLAVFPKPLMPVPQRFGLALGLLLSHPLMDFFQSPLGFGFTAGPGVALFSPVTDRRFMSPFSVFLGVQHRSWAQLLSGHNVVAVLSELLYLLPLLLLVDVCRGRQTRVRQLGHGPEKNRGAEKLTADPHNPGSLPHLDGEA